MSSHHDLALLFDEIVAYRVDRVEDRLEVRPAVGFRVPTGFHQRVNRRRGSVGTGEDVALLNVPAELIIINYNNCQ